MLTHVKSRPLARDQKAVASCSSFSSCCCRMLAELMPCLVRAIAPYPPCTRVERSSSPDASESLRPTDCRDLAKPEALWPAVGPSLATGWGRDGTDGPRWASDFAARTRSLAGPSALANTSAIYRSSSGMLVVPGRCTASCCTHPAPLRSGSGRPCKRRATPGPQSMSVPEPGPAPLAAAGQEVSRGIRPNRIGAGIPLRQHLPRPRDPRRPLGTRNG